MNYVLLHRAGISALLVLGCLAPILLGGCTTARIPATDLEVPLLDIPLPAVLRGQNDLRSRSWTKAFQILHGRLKVEYAYTDHKSLDWDSLYTQYADEVVKAQEEKDREAWYLALRRYVHSIPDGNVQIDLNESLRARAEGASPGIALAELADGAVIVSGVIPGSPADEAGIRWGAVVESWNEKPIAEALESTSILWADAPPATAEMRRAQQLIWLPRGGEGEVCRLTFRNPDADESQAVTLERIGDDYETLSLYRPLWEPVELFSSPIENKSLEDGIQYIRIAAIAPTLSTPFPLRDLRAAVRAAIDAGAPGMILDLRGTQGGDPALAPKVAASFIEEPAFYETPGVLDMETTAFVADSEASVTVEPQLPAYTGPVVVLVDEHTMGPAESVAQFLQGQENVRVCGLSGTYGAPGVPTIELTLPGNYMVFFPDGQLLDAGGRVKGVADGAGAGHVLPDVMVELDRDAARALYEEQTDIVLDQALALLGG